MDGLAAVSAYTAWIVTVLTAAALLERVGWPFALLAFVRPQLAALSVAVFGVGVIALAPLWVPTAGALCFFVNAYPVFACPRFSAPQLRAPKVRAPDGGRSTDLRVMWADTETRADALAIVAKRAALRRCDLVAVRDLPTLSGAERTRLFPRHRHTLIGAGGAVTVLSVAPVTASPCALPDAVSDHAMAIRVRLDEGTAVDLFILNAPAPITPGRLAARDAVLAAVRAAAPAHGRYLVIGHAAVTPWSIRFRRLPGRRAGDPRRASTWLARTPLLGLPVNHALLGAGLELSAVRIGAPAKSLHRPVVVEARASAPRLARL